MLTVFAWLLAFAAALLLDRAVGTWVRHSGLEAWMESHRLVEKTIAFPGTYAFTAIVAIIVAIAHPLRWRAGGFILLATLVSGVNGLVKWIVGRTRPFKLDDAVAQPFILDPFRGGMEGMFQSKNLCFPSGHAALAFATAAAVAMLWPQSRWRWIGFVVAAIVATERVAENAHWVSDVVCAAALGVGGVHLINWIVIRVFDVKQKHE